MNMSYQERHLWAHLMTSVAILCYYLIRVFQLPEDHLPHLVLTLGLVLITIGMSILAEILINLLLYRHRRVHRVILDERDELICLKGHRTESYVAVGAIITLLVHMYLNELLLGGTQPAYKIGTTAMVLHSLWATVFLTSFSGTLTKLFYYRRGY